MLSTAFRKSFFALRFTQSKFANFCHEFNAKPFVVTTYVQNSSSLIIGFQNNQIFLLFPIVKMNANYAEICRVGILEANFQQVLLVNFFLNFSQECCEKSMIQIQQRQVKDTFSDKN